MSRRLHTDFSTEIDFIPDPFFIIMFYPQKHTLANNKSIFV